MTALRALPLVCLFVALYFLLWANVEQAKLMIVVENAVVQFEPGNVRLRVRVTPDPANLALAVGIVGPDFETSSLEQLDGDRARITRWWEAKDVPAGDYDALATVARADGTEWHAKARVIVLARY